MGPKLTGKRCLCSACGRVFSTVANFDRHRKGPMTERRCDGVGLVLGADGIWREPGTHRAQASLVTLLGDLGTKPS